MSEHRYVDKPPEGADGWTEVWRDDLRYAPRLSGNPIWRWFLKIFERLTARSTEPELERQRNFNLATLDMLRDLRSQAEAIRLDLRSDIEAVQLDGRDADEALAVEIAHVREQIPIAVMRNDALIAALDQKIETLAVRLRDVTNPYVAAAAATAAPHVSADDLLYRRLEDALRGSEAEVRAAMQPYVDYARDHQPLIDAGCGRGELLELCLEAGIQARGFDTNERSAADLVARGFEVARAGIPDCFSGLADRSTGSIAAIHVVEHLPLDALLALFREAHRVLRPGGLLMLETPNAESLAMSASDFWRDPTHLAPRHPAALTVLGREHGFSIEEIRAVHPFPEANHFHADLDDLPSMRRLVDALNARMFGGQDLRLVLRRE
jgi:SAM-dependent methyltransferase